MFAFALLTLFSSLRLVYGHIAFWHPSMWGYNVTFQMFPYDNRPVAPLAYMPFSEWWFHGHLKYPPHPKDIFELPAGQVATSQLACSKGATTWSNASADSGDFQNPKKPNDPCPGSEIWQYHTNGLYDVKGCALGIAYKSDVSQVKPEDFTIFSVNQTCVWNRFTDFAVPEKMPPCPDGKCTCAWFWIHSFFSGSMQMYMNGFQCNVTNSVSNVPLAKPQLARRCGVDRDHGKLEAVPGNCTYGAKQPLYWLQKDHNNMFEEYFGAPFYNDLYNFKDGAQNDIFEGYYSYIPVPGPNQTALPVVANPTGSGGGRSTATVPSPTKSGGSSIPNRNPTASGGSSIHPSHPSTKTPGSSSVPPSRHSPRALGVGSIPRSGPSPTTTGGSSISSTESSHVPSGGSGTTLPFHRSPPSASVALPSTTPSKSQCPKKHSTSSFSRRHSSAERRSPFTHKVTLHDAA